MPNQLHFNHQPVLPVLRPYVGLNLEGKEKQGISENACSYFLLDSERKGVENEALRLDYIARYYCADQVDVQVQIRGG